MIRTTIFTQIQYVMYVCVCLCVINDDYSTHKNIDNMIQLILTTSRVWVVEKITITLQIPFRGLFTKRINNHITTAL
jgi:hypothetical protein